MTSIGIIGNGFVGGALAKGFAQHTDVKVYDKDPKRSLNSVLQTCSQDVLFVAVPTPMKVENYGKCDTEILEQALDMVNQAVNDGSDKITVVRSTIPPSFLRENYHRWEALELVYMPEFLTERTADLDFIQSRRFIFGTMSGVGIPGPLKLLFDTRFPATKQVPMTWEAASLVKYGTNVFFTTKLSFFNELAEVAEAMGEDPQAIIDEVCNDGRIGLSHNKVPGHDGDKGWGGHCFPKDNRAFSTFGHALGVTCYMADAAWLVNNRVRKKKDWEEMKGRAVS